jgi:hypothetical protein
MLNAVKEKDKVTQEPLSFGEAGPSRTQANAFLGGLVAVSLSESNAEFVRVLSEIQFIKGIKGAEVSKETVEASESIAELQKEQTQNSISALYASVAVGIMSGVASVIGGNMTAADPAKNMMFNQVNELFGKVSDSGIKAIEQTANMPLKYNETLQQGYKDALEKSKDYLNPKEEAAEIDKALDALLNMIRMINQASQWK